MTEPDFQLAWAKFLADADKLANRIIKAEVSAKSPDGLEAQIEAYARDMHLEGVRIGCLPPSTMVHNEP